MSEYPEHTKLKQVHEHSQAIGEFMDWLNEKGIILAVVDEYTYSPARTTTQGLLAEFYGIDLKALDAEKRDMLADLRRRAALAASEGSES